MDYCSVATITGTEQTTRPPLQQTTSRTNSTNLACHHVDAFVRRIVLRQVHAFQLPCAIARSGSLIAHGGWRPSHHLLLHPLNLRLEVGEDGRDGFRRRLADLVQPVNAQTARHAIYTTGIAVVPSGGESFPVVFVYKVRRPTVSTTQHTSKFTVNHFTWLQQACSL